MSMNLVTLLYLIASVCFIQALKGLSHPTTSIRGNMFGMIGMGIAAVTTVFLIANLANIVNVIRILAMAVGGIVVANTMLMSIYERTREIGTLRALGWTAPRILGQIVQESLFLCLLAAVFGAVIGVVLLTLVSRLPAVSQFITPAWNVQTFVIAFAVALGLGLLGGIFPAWRASRLQPVEALRYE